MTDPIKDDKLLVAIQEARARSDLLNSSLPDKVQAAALTFNSKLPFHALCLREVLVHRVADLASVAVEMLENGRIVPAAILSRAVVETVAVAFNLHKRLREFVDTKKVDVIHEFLVKALVGSRHEDAEVQAVSIQTLVNHVARTVEGYRSSYDILSEYAHPNWAGGSGAYSTLDRVELVLHVGPKHNRTTGLLSAAIILSTTLMLFEHYYNDMIPLLHQFNAHFEEGTE